MRLLKPISDRFALLVALLLPTITVTVHADTPSCNVAEAGLSAASRIRGLQQKKKVPCFLRSRDKIREFILSTVDTKVPAEKLRMEELVFKAIGFIPQEFDYKKGIIDLYVSQIGGYYDPEKDHYIMADWMPNLLQAPVAVHELTHALQDQYYDLEKFVDMNLANSDELLARSALVEGDATAVMHDYTRGLAHLPPLEEEPVIDSLLMQNVLSLGFSAGDGIPDSLKLYLLFPYTSGLRFAHVMLRKGGYRQLDKAFRDPPKSTEEILHPEKYGQGDFKKISSTDAVGPGCSADSPLRYSDTLGEFAISTLLASSARRKIDAVEAAKGWGGDLVVVRGKAEDLCLVWVTKWDSVKDADEFRKELLFKFGKEGKDGAEVKLEKGVVYRTAPDTVIFQARVQE